MASDVAKLKLFSYNWYENPTTTRRGSSDKSFYTRSTPYSQAYGVNTAPSSVFQTGYVGLDNKNRLTVSSTVTPYEGNLSLSNTPGRLSTADSVGATPDIPSRYTDQVSRYAVSDANASELLSQPEFLLPRVGSGLRVTTDGNGGVSGIAIDPTAVALQKSYSLAPLQNRSEITAGAVFKVDPTDSPYTTNTLLSPSQSIQRKSPLNANPNPNNLLNRPLQTGGLNRLPGQNNSSVTNLGGIQSPLNGLDGLSLRSNGSLDGNVLLSRMAQLNPPENGLSVSGFNSQLDPTQSRQLATAQAGFDITTRQDMRQVLAQIASAARYQDTYASVYNKMDRLMDGRMPFGANPPANIATVNALSSSYRITPPDAIAATDSMMDSAARRGGNGYLPFQFGSGDNNFFGNSSFSGGQGNQNAFRGSFSASADSQSGHETPGQFRPRRTPFALIA